MIAGMGKLTCRLSFMLDKILDIWDDTENIYEI